MAQGITAVLGRIALRRVPACAVPSPRARAPAAAGPAGAGRLGAPAGEGDLAGSVLQAVLAYLSDA